MGAQAVQPLAVGRQSRSGVWGCAGLLTFNAFGAHAVAPQVQRSQALGLLQGLRQLHSMTAVQLLPRCSSAVAQLQKDEGLWRCRQGSDIDRDCCKTCFVSCLVRGGTPLLQYLGKAWSQLLLQIACTVCTTVGMHTMC